VDDSPLGQFLEAVDRLDVDAVMALAAPDVRILTADGRHAEGADAVRALLADFLGSLRSTAHRITAQWHVDDVWIAEVDATYELRDWLQLNALPRAFVLRMEPEGIADLRAYGAHERPLTEHRTGEEGMWIGDRWIPPL
jgi:SnoaL-like domain